MFILQSIKNKNEIIFSSLALFGIIGLMLVVKSPWYLVGGILVLAISTLMVIKPKMTLLAGLFLIYSNIPVVALKLHALPQSVAAAASVFLMVPFLVYLLIKQDEFRLDYIFLLMILYLGIMVLSGFFARDRELALLNIWTFVSEGLLLYLIILNTVRDVRTLKQAIWTILLVGSILGAMSLYQEISKSYQQQFAGLALRDVSDYSGPDDLNTTNSSSPIRKAQRAAGPIGDPNRYAQILLVLLPLAFLRFKSEPSLVLKIMALAASALILCGIVLSYSRGAFLAIVILLGFLTAFRYIRVRYLLATGIALLLLIVVASPAYFSRINTIRGVAGMFSNRTEIKPDQVTRGRLTEMLAAAYVFIDHPLLGVGPGHFSPYYSINYMSNPDIAFRHLVRTRRAHILYFEMAAETGILGLFLFLTILTLVIYRLWQIRRKYASLQPEWAHLATGFILSLIGYMATALFLHLSYQRYFWLLLGLAGATVQILSGQIPPKEEISQRNS
jgi:putative inorganic carbon (hco3(-)) transporter